MEDDTPQILANSGHFSSITAFNGWTGNGSRLNSCLILRKKLVIYSLARYTALPSFEIVNSDSFRFPLDLSSLHIVVNNQFFIVRDRSLKNVPFLLRLNRESQMEMRSIAFFSLNHEALKQRSISRILAFSNFNTHMTFVEYLYDVPCNVTQLCLINASIIKNRSPVWTYSDFQINISTYALKPLTNNILCYGISFINCPHLFFTVCAMLFLYGSKRVSINENASHISPFSLIM